MNDLNIKQQLIKQIKGFESRYFNDDQKEIAIKIIENCPEEEAKEYFSYITYKRKVGFAFDSSPEIAKGRIITPKVINDKSINLNQKTDNHLLVGDNYNALKVLNVTHKGMIDVIYIDPPYNTESALKDGNQSSKSGKSKNFMYKDKYGRTGWLNMMNARLLLAKELLSEEGVIYVSIDDNEQAYLKVLMDEVFGEDRFVSTFIWRKKTSGARQKSIAGRHEYIHCYTKSNNKEIFLVNKYENEDFDHFEEDGRGYNLENLQRGTSSTKPYIIKDEEGNEYYPKEGSTWRWSEAKLKKEWERVVFANNNVYTKTYEKGGKWPHTLLTDKKYGSSRSGRESLKSLIGDNDFSTVKPVNLIKFLISITPNKDAIVLDFFAGSGTTAEATFELNNEDGGNRKVILATNNENNIAEEVTQKRLKTIIHNEYKNESFSYIELDDSKIIENTIFDIEKVENDVINGLKFINNKFDQRDIQLYYSLAALNPLEEEENDIN